MNPTNQISSNQLQQIPVTFTSGYTFRVLCKATLPALPTPGDFVDLGILAYQVTGKNWQLTPDGQVDIRIVLIPQIGVNGERPSAYPQEEDLPDIWKQATASAEETLP